MVLQFTTLKDADRKKYSLVIRSTNGSGKTLCFLIPILNSLKPGLPCTKPKTVNGKKIDDIFIPQGVIIVQTALLVDQLEGQLNWFLKEAAKLDHKSQKLNFTVGKMDKQGHKPGDIVVAMAQSFANRFDRKNISFQQAKFVAIDEIDEIYDHSQPELKRILEATQKDSHVNLLVSSATMRPEFKHFFHENVKNSIDISLAEVLKGEGHKQSITLQGVTNYVMALPGERARYEYVVLQLFRELYSDKNRKPPKAFIFFNSVKNIQEFRKVFNQIVKPTFRISICCQASDLTLDDNEYLRQIKMEMIAGHRLQNGAKVELSFAQKRKIMGDFRNNEFRVLLATNIVARGIDIRDVCLVINVGTPLLPPSNEHPQRKIDVDTYLHRVGRTGRYSDEGVALTLLEPKEEDELIKAVRQVHKVDVQRIKSLAEMVGLVYKCISHNSTSPEDNAT